MISSACVLIVNPEGLILSVSRKDNHDQWGLVGGKLDPWETFSQAAARELKEETGLDATNLEFIFARTGENYLTATFSCDYTGTPESREGALTAWKTPKELADSIFGEYNKMLFDFVGINYKDTK